MPSFSAAQPEPSAAAVAWLLGASMRPSRKVATLLYRWVRSKRKVAAKKAAARKARARASARRQKNLLLLVAALAEEEQAASQPGKRVRAVIARAEQGWKGSVMYGYLYNQTAATKPQVYKANFRMAPQTFDKVVSKIEGSGLSFVPKMGCVKREVKPVSFKLGVCLYILALGASAKTAGNCASLGRSTVELWLSQFTEVCTKVLKPQYMPAKPLEPSLLAQVRSEFSARRGIPNAAMACDGSHVPFRTHHADYRNYKGWYSILVVAFVNSFHLFVGGTVGFPGKAGDNTVLRTSWLMQQIKDHPDEYLGEDGVVLGDSGASDGDGVFMNPYPHPKTPQEFYFNFCHSSTRFYVEETFGRWKNRFASY